MDTADTAASPPHVPSRFGGYAFVGSFTTEKRKARGTGIDVYKLDAGSGAWIPVGHVGGLVNPSFLVADSQRGVLYAVHGDSDFASSFQVDRKTGELRPLGQAATGGWNGVHQALDRAGRFLLVANYASGSVAVLPVESDGTLRPFIHRLDLLGEPGPHRREQVGSHPHHIVPDPSGRYFLVPDKGLDCVFVLALDGASGRIDIVSRAALRPGAGPRHIAFHPHRNIAFLVNELESALVVCRWHAVSGTLEPLQQCSTLPSSFFGASTAAAIAVSPCGTFVYASNRGHDSVVCCAYDNKAQRLAPLYWTTSGGHDPRFITLHPDGRQIVAANEQGDSLVFLNIGQDDGRLREQGTVLPSLSPSTIAFLAQ